MNNAVQQIKERLSIEEVVSSYIKLEKAGANFKTKCPFHNEKTPSFFVSPDRGSYYCFGCSAKGDIFTFVEEFEGLDFKGALKLLAEKAGVSLKQYNPKEGDLVFSEKEKLYKAMEETTKFFESNLATRSPSGDLVTDPYNYLKSRGLEDKTIKDFRVGFIKNDWRELYTYLKQKGFGDLEMEKAGLVKKPASTSVSLGGTEKGFYDRFRGRIMFPISDSSGRIIAFSGRLFDDPSTSSGQVENQPKYLNSPETPIFNKSSVLYGLDRAKDSIRKNNFSILVEGQFDLILSHQAGFRNTVATSGTALSDSTVSKENVVSNLGLIRRLSSNIVLAFDSDRAGFNASSRASKIALSFGMDVKVVSMEDGIDPADLISKEGVDAWKNAIRNSKHIIEFLLNRTLKNFADDTRKAGREIKEKILPYVQSLESSIEQAHFIKKISEQSQIPENALKDDLKKVQQELKYKKKENEEIKEMTDKKFRKDYIERRLLGIILWQKTLEKQKIKVDEILKEVADILSTKEEEILEKTKDNAEDLIFEAEVFYEDDVNLEKEVLELLNNLKEEYLKEQLFQQMQELQIAEKNNDKIKSVEILKSINEINSEIQNIKSGRLKK